MDKDMMAVVACMVVGGLIGLIPIFLTRRAMDGVPEPFRPMKPIQVWLLALPLYNLYWVFMVYPPMMKGYKAALADLGVRLYDDAGEGKATALCVCYVLMGVPLVNFLAAPVVLVLLLMTLSKARELRKLLELKHKRLARPNPPAPAA